MKKIVTIAAAAVAAAGLWWMTQEQGGEAAAQAQIVLPDRLSDMAQMGETVFDARCAACHGPNAIGVEGAGPPLIHKIYEPGHHGDAAFYRAARQGVPAHHWPYGNMPPVQGITDAEIGSVIAYIRELQRANGIN